MTAEEMTAEEMTSEEYAERMAWWLGLYPHRPRQRWVLRLPAGLVDRLDAEVSLDYVDEAGWASPRVRSAQTGCTARELLERWAATHLCEPVRLDAAAVDGELGIRCAGTHGPRWLEDGWRTDGREGP